MTTFLHFSRASQTRRRFLKVIFSFLIATLPAGFDTDGNWRDTSCTSWSKNSQSSKLQHLTSKEIYQRRSEKVGSTTLTVGEKGGEVVLWHWWEKTSTEAYECQTTCTTENLLSLDTVSRQKQQPWQCMLTKEWDMVWVWN